LQNCLALSQTLAAMGEANEKELRQVDVLSSKDGKAEASTRPGRSEVEILQHLQLEKYDIAKYDITSTFDMR
jgi:hypothetical protein